MDSSSDSPEQERRRTPRIRPKSSFDDVLTPRRSERDTEVDHQGRLRRARSATRPASEVTRASRITLSSPQPPPRRRIFSATDDDLDQEGQRTAGHLLDGLTTPTMRQFVSPDVPGYVGFANLPNQVHRKSVKKGFEFTLMVVGESGLGKSTLVNSLFLTDLYPDRQIPKASDKSEKTVKIEASTVEIEERGVKLRLTVVDTPGFADAINNEESFKSVIKYIDDQYERYLHDESGLNRRNIVDNRVHCCFYFLNPASHGLKPLDIEFMKAVDHKVNIVPVIAKSDTLTKQECIRLKRKILDQIKHHGIQIYTMPEVDTDEDEDYKEQCKQLKAAVPFAVVGSTTVIEIRGRKVRGRMYPWGVVEVENPEHCDFIKLRTMLITHMQDLQEVTHEIHYENFRSEKLQGPATPASARKRVNRRSDVDKEEKLTEKERQLQEKEHELRRMHEMLAKMQAEMQQHGGNKPPHPTSQPPAPPSGPVPAARTATLPTSNVNGAMRNSTVNGHAPSHANTMQQPKPQKV